MHLSRTAQGLLSQARGRCGVFYVKLDAPGDIKAARGLVRHAPSLARLVLFSPVDGFMYMLTDEGQAVARELEPKALSHA